MFAGFSDAAIDKFPVNSKNKKILLASRNKLRDVRQSGFIFIDLI
jgi:hypothetical protein